MRRARPPAARRRADEFRPHAGDPLRRPRRRAAAGGRVRHTWSRSIRPTSSRCRSRRSSAGRATCRSTSTSSARRARWGSRSATDDAEPDLAVAARRVLQRAAGVEDDHRVGRLDAAVPRRSTLSACSAAPPSGAALMPSVEPSSRMPRDHVGVATRRSRCRRSRGRRAARGSRRSPSARAGRRPPCARSATSPIARRPARRRGRSARSARPAPRPSSAARPARFQPMRSISSNAFHMPTMPVPPPVG